MSPSQPYDTVHREDGSAIFDGDLPALARIGRRYDELYQAYYHFTYPREYLETEQAFVKAIEDAGERAARGDGNWTAIDNDLETRFGKSYRRLRSLLPSIFLDAAKRSRPGLVQCLQMLVTSAKAELARRASASDTSDEPGLRAAAAWQPPVPPNPLESPQFRAQVEELKRAAPAAQDRIAGMMRGLSMFMGGSQGGQSIEQQMDEHMKAVGQSPQLQSMLDLQKRALERVRKLNPGAARAMERELEQMERMAADPAGFRAEMAARALDQAAASEETKRQLPALVPQSRAPGRFRFDCGGVDQPTEHQKLLFTWLAEHQEELAPKIEKALRTMHAEMAGNTDLDDPKERVLFPENAAESDVPLSYFRIESFILPEAGDRIGMTFESIFGHEEHGCALVIEGGEVTDFGDTEVLSALEDYGDEDEDMDEYDDDGEGAGERDE